MKNLRTLFLLVLIGSASISQSSNASLWQSFKKNVCEYSGTVVAASSGLIAAYCGIQQKPSAAIGTIISGLGGLAMLYPLSETMYAWAHGTGYQADWKLVIGIEESNPEKVRQAIAKGANLENPFKRIDDFIRSYSGKKTQLLMYLLDYYQTPDKHECYINHKRFKIICDKYSRYAQENKSAYGFFLEKKTVNCVRNQQIERLLDANHKKKIQLAQEATGIDHRIMNNIVGAYLR